MRFPSRDVLKVSQSSSRKLLTFMIAKSCGQTLMESAASRILIPATNLCTVEIYGEANID